MQINSHGLSLRSCCGGSSSLWWQLFLRLCHSWLPTVLCMQLLLLADDKIEQLLRWQVCPAEAESEIARQDPNAEIVAGVAWIPSVGFDAPFEATRIRSGVWAQQSRSNAHSIHVVVLPALTAFHVRTLPRRHTMCRTLPSAALLPKGLAPLMLRTPRATLSRTSM